MNEFICFLHLETNRSTDVKTESLLHQKKKKTATASRIFFEQYYYSPTIITTIPTAMKTTLTKLGKVKKD